MLKERILNILSYHCNGYKAIKTTKLSNNAFKSCLTFVLTLGVKYTFVDHGYTPRTKLLSVYIKCLLFPYATICRNTIEHQQETTDGYKDCYPHTPYAL